MIDTRSPEELAEAGITIRRDEHGKRHITMRADPMVLLRGGPVGVECGLRSRPECQDTVVFTESGPSGGWIPPHGTVRTWTCPACRGDLKPLVTNR